MKTKFAPFFPPVPGGSGFSSVVRLTDPRYLSDPGAENVFYFRPREDIGKFLRVCRISRLLVLER